MKPSSGSKLENGDARAPENGKSVEPENGQLLESAAPVKSIQEVHVLHVNYKRIDPLPYFILVCFRQIVER